MNTSGSWSLSVRPQYFLGENRTRWWEARDQIESNIETSGGSAERHFRQTIAITDTYDHNPKNKLKIGGTFAPEIFGILGSSRFCVLVRWSSRFLKPRWVSNRSWHVSNFTQIISNIFIITIIHRLNHPNFPTYTRPINLRLLHRISPRIARHWLNKYAWSCTRRCTF